MKSAFLIVGRAIAMPFVLGWQCFLFCLALAAEVAASVFKSFAKCFTWLADRLWTHLIDSTY